MKIYQALYKGETSPTVLIVDWDSQTYLMPKHDGYTWPQEPWIWETYWSDSYFSDELWEWLPEW